MTRITMLVQKGCLFSGTSASQELFLLANSWWQRMHPEQREKLFQFEYVSADGLPVKGGTGMTLSPGKSIDQVRQTDVILIPPYLKSIRHSLPEFTESVAWLKDQHHKGVAIAGMCTGTFILAETGLLNGKTATTNWQFVRAFQKRFPLVKLQPGKILTVEDNLICSGATTAILDLCLYFVKRYGSSELADNCSKALLIEPRHRSQAPYIVFDRFKNHSDKKIADAQSWLEEHFAENVIVETLAKHSGLSSRQFQRRFKDATGDSPLGYLQKIRIEIAKEKLEKTRDDFSTITWDVGYEDVNSFRKLFKKHTSISPKEYRYKFARL